MSFGITYEIVKSDIKKLKINFGAFGKNFKNSFKQNYPSYTKLLKNRRDNISKSAFKKYFYFYM